MVLTGWGLWEVTQGHQVELMNAIHALIKENQGSSLPFSPHVTGKQGNYLGSLTTDTKSYALTVASRLRTLSNFF